VPVISLTGSRETGVQVTKTGADRLKHIHLELGGKNAIIVLDDADLDLAVEGTSGSAFGTSGQRCTAASRVIAHEAVLRPTRLPPRLRGREDAPRYGWEDDSDVGPVINKSALDKIDSYTRSARTRARRSSPAARSRPGNGLDKGFYYRPTIFGDVDPQMRIAQEEIFGPTTAVIKVRDVDEAIEVSNGIKYGLSSVDLHARREQRLPRDARPQGRDHVHQRGTIGAEVHPPVRRRQGHGQRPPRGWAGRARLLHRVEVDLRRLLGKLQKAQIDT
jgi:aldehyde dehydrogenase (NAD+)